MHDEGIIKFDALALRINQQLWSLRFLKIIQTSKINSNSHLIDSVKIVEDSNPFAQFYMYIVCLVVLIFITPVTPFNKKRLMNSSKIQNWEYKNKIRINQI